MLSDVKRWMKLDTTSLVLSFMSLLFCSMSVLEVFSQSNRFEFSKPLMGTDVKIVIYANDSLSANNVAESAFSRINELNDALSDYQIDSELNQLSKTYQQTIAVSSDLWSVLYTAQSVSVRSGGAFDVTAGPLTLLWRRAMRRSTLPDKTALDEARNSVSYKYLYLNEQNQTVKLLENNMRLDLGGIAKGYVADQALQVLIDSGYPQAVVDAGGDIALGNAPPSLDGWEIQIFEDDAYSKIMILANCGIAVSGDTYQYLLHNGVRYSHIVDPRTGFGVTHERKVAVIATTAMIADAWASAYSVMDWGKAVVNVQEHQDLHVHLMESNGENSHQIKTGLFLLQEK